MNPSRILRFLLLPFACLAGQFKREQGAHHGMVLAAGGWLIFTNMTP